MEVVAGFEHDDAPVGMEKALRLKMEVESLSGAQIADALDPSLSRNVARPVCSCPCS